MARQEREGVAARQEREALSARQEREAAAAAAARQERGAAAARQDREAATTRQERREIRDSDDRRERANLSRQEKLDRADWLCRQERRIDEVARERSISSNYDSSLRQQQQQSFNQGLQ